eukprot:759173-Amorphochlora_amoeboformis.AAC.1
MGSRDGPEQNIEEKDKEFGMQVFDTHLRALSHNKINHSDGDYHYLSAGEDDDEHGKLPGCSN